MPYRTFKQCQFHISRTLIKSADQNICTYKQVLDLSSYHHHHHHFKSTHIIRVCHKYLTFETNCSLQPSRLGNIKAGKLSLIHFSLFLCLNIIQTVFWWKLKFYLFSRRTVQCKRAVVSFQRRTLKPVATVASAPSQSSAILFFGQIDCLPPDACSLHCRHVGSCDSPICYHPCMRDGKRSWHDMSPCLMLIVISMRHSLHVSLTQVPVHRAVVLLVLPAVVFTARRICIARTMPWQDVCLSVCQSVRPFVRPSVCLSHAGILSKRLNISSKFFTVVFFLTKPMATFRRGYPLTGASNARWYEKITIFD